MGHVAEGNMPSPDEPDDGRSSGLRQLVDSLVCLALAVILFRAFQVEGYMISTGSMAPALLGFHKQVECPACGHHFAFGVAYDQDYDEGETPGLSETAATCPNCGRSGIDVSHIPRNQGDQLLVHKGAYLLHDPRRWEVAVFRNPYKTTQAYVKRIAGLPGETVAIRHGDLYTDGTLQRKDLISQRAIRILVFDHDHEPQNDPQWQSRWVPQGDPPGWRRDSTGFVIDSTVSPAAPATHGDSSSPPRPRTPSPSSTSWNWLSYRHWIRAGGNHETSVELPPLNVGPSLTDGWLPVRYDSVSRRLTAFGVLSDENRDRLLAVSDDPAYAEAIRDLAARSHIAPITDHYGYNRTRGGVPPTWVRDIMLAVRLTVTSDDGEFSVQMTDGTQVFDFTIDVGAGEAWLTVDDAAVPARTASLPAELLSRPIDLEMSLFDRQVLVAINGRPAMDPLYLPEPENPDPPRWPVRLGARGLSARVDSLRLYRDVHYTSRKAETYQLGDDEYFMLGDNSPVSHDSRRWPEPAVRRHLFLGRPFVVHLPSRQAEFTFRGTQHYVRVPDFSRIRYIR